VSKRNEKTLFQYAAQLVNKEIIQVTLLCLIYYLSLYIHLAMSTIHCGFAQSSGQEEHQDAEELAAPGREFWQREKRYFTNFNNVRDHLSSQTTLIEQSFLFRIQATCMHGYW